MPKFNPHPHHQIRLRLLLLCFVLSGIAGLTYQAAWSQRFAQVFGASELAVATVLAAYMAGLALGAAAAGRLAHHIRRPLIVYAWLELGIAAAALAIPTALGLASRIQLFLFGQGSGEHAASSSAIFYLIASFVILMVPTACMGATLPLLARHAVRRDEDITPRVGMLYTANTLGAAAGALGSAYLLLPALGLDHTIWAAVGLNATVFFVAWAMGRENPEAVDTEAAKAEAMAIGNPGVGSLPPPDDSSSTATRPRPKFSWILPAMLFSGAVSFTYEVSWTRLLGHVLGGSLYAFGVMLATFLTGLALGSGAIAWFSPARSHTRLWFAWCQIAIGTLFTISFGLADHLPWLSQSLAEHGLGPFLSGVALGVATLLPGAVAIGATFPLAVRILANDARQAAQASARVFAWNTAGAITGAIGAGFVLLPALGYASTVTLAAATSFLLALLSSVTFPRRRAASLIAVLGLLAVLFGPLENPVRLLANSPLGPEQGAVRFLGIGRSANVVLLDRGDAWRLTTNGLPEALIHRPGSRPGESPVARWLGLLPLAARPEARSMLVIGFGGGVALEEIPSSVRELQVVELEPEVVRANREVASERRRDPLADPRLTLHFDDARSALLLAGRPYDAIVSQPSHPWTAGASHLFTRELFTLVRDRLTTDGVFVQWLGLAAVDGDLIRSVVATLTTVFPHVEVMLPERRALLFLASKSPLDLGRTIENALESAPSAWKALGIRTPEDFLSHRVLDSSASRRFGVGFPLVTDGWNRLQTRSPRILGRGLGSVEAQERLFGPFDPGLPKLPADSIYFIRCLLRSGQTQRASRLASELAPPRQWIGLGLVAMAEGRRERAEDLLRKAHAAGNNEALAELLEIYREEISRGSELTLLRNLEPGSAEFVVARAWRLEGQRDWQGIAALDPDLESISDPRHGLARAALVLRVRWRIEMSDQALAAEALPLIESSMGPSPTFGELLLRARTAIQAGRTEKALAGLHEMVRGIRQGRFDSRHLETTLTLTDQLAERFPTATVDSRYASLRALISELME